MQSFKIVALVPMRHHSQRVPQKNFREMAGKPLYHHILNTLDDCPEIDRVVVDTDSKIIMEGLRVDFPQIMIIERPKALCADNVSMNDILLYDTNQVPADLYLQTHSTNPLLRSETISEIASNFCSFVKVAQPNTNNKDNIIVMQLPIITDLILAPF